MLIARVGDREIGDVRSTCCLQSAAAEPEAASTPVGLGAASLDRRPAHVTRFCAEGQNYRRVAFRAFKSAVSCCPFRSYAQLPMDFLLHRTMLYCIVCFWAFLTSK
jgi:hypothetical protein